VSGPPPSWSEPPGIPPPIPPGARRLAAAGKFVAGSFLSIGAGFLLFVAVFQDLKKVNGCAVAQLIYIVPVMIFLLLKKQPAWAFGIVFGGAVVLLLGSICSQVRWGG
jgi:hypothetical protein